MIRMLKIMKNVNTDGTHWDDLLGDSGQNFYLKNKIKTKVGQSNI